MRLSAVLSEDASPHRCAVLISQRARDGERQSYDPRCGKCCETVQS